MFHKLPALALILTLALPGLSFAATPLNINQASAAVIAKSLDGIGQGRAEAIVAWREAHGPFKKIADLRHVKGIGKATIQRNLAAIRLADDSPTTTKAEPPHSSKRDRMAAEQE